MRVISIIAFTILLFSCKSQEKVLINPEAEKLVETNLKKNEFYAIVQQRSKSRKGNNLKETFLLIGESKYFVKFDEGYVSEEKLLKHLNNKIKIKGEIKNGPWEVDLPGSILEKTQPIKGRSGDYIAVYKILEN